jgi:zinc protease
VGERLLSEPLKGGRVIATKTIAEVNVTEWTLDNGVRVVVRPSDFTNDEVRMSATSPGGLSLVKAADLDSARVAASVAEQGGLGSFDALSLRRFLSGKLLSIGARVDELDERVFGNAALDDLELLLQATYLKFTAPRRDEPAFSAWRTREIERVRNRLLSPEIGFDEELTKLSTQNHPLRRPFTPELLGRVDLDKALEIYRQRFANAADFTFVFVGHVELERLKPLVEQYLGSLPAAPNREKWRDTKVFYPRGVKTLTLRKGSEPKSRVALTFHGAEKWSRDGANDLKTLREVLRLRLREVLREDLGGVYGVQVSGWLSRRPHPEYIMNIGFGCAPGSVETLKQAVFTELLALSEHGISEDYLQKVKESRRRTLETDLRDDAYWQRELERAYTHGEDPRLILESTMLDKVTSDRLRAVAKKFAKSKDYVLGVLEPEQGL